MWSVAAPDAQPSQPATQLPIKLVNPCQIPRPHSPYLRPVAGNARLHAGGLHSGGEERYRLHVCRGWGDGGRGREQRSFVRPPPTCPPMCLHRLPAGRPCQVGTHLQTIVEAKPCTDEAATNEQHILAAVAKLSVALHRGGKRGGSWGSAN